MKGYIGAMNYKQYIGHLITVDGSLERQAVHDNIINEIMSIDDIRNFFISRRQSRQDDQVDLS